MSRKKHGKDKTEKANAEDEKNTDEYQCSGKVEIDFPRLCALLDIKDIPAVSTEQPASSILTDTEGEVTENRQSHINAASFWSKPRLQVELENKDPLSTRSMKVPGWKVDEQIGRVLQKMLPSLSQLQTLQFWQAGLTDQLVISLMNTISLCSNLSLTHLSLRNNRIGDESARLIGAALSTKSSSNKNLLSLNLAFNCIGDAGATHIAQGLRLNRALLFLSLSNNQIGDSGAAHLAAILGKFSLTHEEVVERRKLLLEKTQAEASKKDERTAASRENPKSNKKSSDVKVLQSKGGKPGGKEKQLPAQEDQTTAALNEQVELEIRNPLLEPSLQHRAGQLFLPGNTTLTSLNLAGNRITEKSLPRFLTSLEMQQGEEGGLLRLCLQRNRFPLECESYVKIEELIALKHQRKNSSEVTEEEGQGA
ncbi:hypothetical protein INR49_027494 [Caranx melampygus]|nr:hypothetical protein INR49_027494 [Caranx melampygus]